MRVLGGSSDSDASCLIGSPWCFNRVYQIQGSSDSTRTLWTLQLSRSKTMKKHVDTAPPSKTMQHNWSRSLSHPFLQCLVESSVPGHMPHVTRQASHVTRHEAHRSGACPRDVTSTRHTSHATRRTSRITRHTPYFPGPATANKNLTSP